MQPRHTARAPISRRALCAAGLWPMALLALGCNRAAVSATDGTENRDAGRPRRRPLLGDAAVDGGPAGWARGGTALLGTTVNPFPNEALDPCELTVALTAGPCHAQTLERRDISEGELGLPMRLQLRVFDDRCRPLENAVVDVWHTAARGVYSGSDAPEPCTLGDGQALTTHAFRGTQRSGSDGQVAFDSCFPGWYRGRSLHVHLSVTTEASALFTTQLFFDDALGDDIIMYEPEYRERGPRDTTNTADGVLAGRDVAPFLFETKRTREGALLAYKTLIVATV